MKIKNSVRKKILTSLLIGVTLGTTLAGIGPSKSFAASRTDLSHARRIPASNRTAKNLINQMGKRGSELKIWDLSSDDLAFVKFNGNLYVYDYASQSFLIAKVTVNGHTFMFDSKSLWADKGWFNFEGERYYFDPTTFQTLSDGVHMIGNIRYGFKDGHIVCSGWTVDNGHGYLSNKKGEILTGWYSTKDARYYLNPDMVGQVYTGWYDGDRAGHMYFDTATGKMAQGVVNVHNGRARGGSNRDGIYLFQRHGKGVNYYVNEDAGLWTDNSNGYRYYFDKNNGGRAIQNGWYHLSQSYTNQGDMYFGADGNMAEGIVEIHDKGVTRSGVRHDGLYLFQSPSLTNLNAFESYGWYSAKDGYTYYFDKNNNDGAALKNTIREIDGKLCKFDSKCHLVNKR